MGHFVSSPTEREKRDRSNRGVEREGQGIKENELELVFVKHYAPNCLTLTLFDSNTA